jgi:hypothetical protein
MAKVFRSLDFVCPICGVQPEERCRLIGGGLRFESHIERKYIAKDSQRKRSTTKPKEAKPKAAKPKAATKKPQR